MAKTANINIRIEPDIKAQAEAVYGSFGISVTDAINVFLRASIMDGGFPFQPHRPRYNNTTLRQCRRLEILCPAKPKPNDTIPYLVH